MQILISNQTLISAKHPWWVILTLNNKTQCKSILKTRLSSTIRLWCSCHCTQKREIIIDSGWSSQHDCFSRLSQYGLKWNEKSNRVEMTNDYMFIAILTITTLFTSLTIARVTYVLSDYLSCHSTLKGNYQSVRSKENFLKKP